MKIYATQKNTKAKSCNDIGLTLYVLMTVEFPYTLVPSITQQHPSSYNRAIKTNSNIFHQPLPI